ncbi:YheC/YheD family protein [Baia soyae]|uniref:YheC/D-like protein n=1 Tax=Baia soyae TaxID=1544746 RepID=A0A4R2S1J9_9BACL|nr:YheC/YheD family protein [Baia soyae]TCP70023.1 YheC/D-like protein [Baia soyae]
MKRYSFRLSSKWTKTLALSKSTHLKANIPTTGMWSKENLQDFLTTYQMVYIKPDLGSQGRGIFRASIKEGKYEVRYEKSTRIFANFNPLYKFINKYTGKEKYLIQQGINMLTHKKSSFDFRIMVQHNPSKQWEVTGIAGRVGNKKLVVTNGSKGATIKPIETLLAPYVPAAKLPTYIRQLETFSVSIGTHLQKVYPSIREIGLDIALDSDLKPWILEFNTSPGLHPFARLPDKRALYKMIRYGKTYGRNKYLY